MDRGHHVGRCGETAEPGPATPHDLTPLEIDLDRLVWDPEYREAMRPLLGRER